jgi:methylthioribose-1-phosphate isomerase
LIMQIQDRQYRTIWPKAQNTRVIEIIDQTQLPFNFSVQRLTCLQDVLRAISDMQVRGAGLIGVTAAYGMYLAALHASDKNFKADLADAGKLLVDTRPTAVNLQWAVARQLGLLENAQTLEEYQVESLQAANKIADEDAAMCKQIGEHGLPLIAEISGRKNGDTVNILTHCNAGWLAFVDYGSATSPIYQAHDAGIDVHVWVDETRPRNQGARLTAWELMQHGVPHTVIPDNTGGHLMQHNLVDIVVTGADRVSRTGDVANKIGTYLKALAAFDNKVPFFVALPSSTFDWSIRDGHTQTPIETRGEDEVRWISGLADGVEKQVMIVPNGSAVANYGFDVTPARLVSGLITERGCCRASEEGIMGLYPERC